MSDEEAKRRLHRRIRLTTIMLPFLIAFLVIGGTFLGFFISAITGYGGLVFPFTFSLGGLVLSIWLSIRIADYVTGETKGRK